MVFENGVTSAQRTKANFLSNFWTYANLYSVDNTNSLLDFLTWMGSRYGVWVLLFGPIGFFCSFLLAVFLYVFVRFPLVYV